MAQQDLSLEVQKMNFEFIKKMDSVEPGFCRPRNFSMGNMKTPADDFYAHSGSDYTSIK